MDFEYINNIERDYYKQDFKEINKLISKIRCALINDENLNCDDIDLKNIIKFNSETTIVSICVFSPNLTPINYYSTSETLERTLNNILSKIKSDKHFDKIDFSNNDTCRIKIEFITEQIPAKIEEIRENRFNDYRFEPGLTGINLLYKNKLHVLMPADSYVENIGTLKEALNFILKETDIKNMTKKISERIQILCKSSYQCCLTKSRAFVSYKDEVFPLYHGVFLEDYSLEKIKDISIKAVDWTIKYQQSNGKFMYYYNTKDDNNIDHEHPKAPVHNLYYNELRHCGGILSLIRVYQLTQDKKYTDSAKKALHYVTKISKNHPSKYGIASYLFLNDKAKLGGTGLALVAMMSYRIVTGETLFDDYIKQYTRHLLTRITETGEFLGFYIHPDYHNGKPLTDMTPQERKETFSFYYPGEALLGLALFANYFDKDDNLKENVKAKCKIALDWIIEERPKFYSKLFTPLPSDSWLMQAIEEWSKNPEFLKESYLNFVFSDATTMIEKMYQKDDTPFIDYEGGFHNYYGDLYNLGGQRAEGLITGYYLAKRLGKDFEKYKDACHKSAKSLLALVNTPINSYPDKNPEKSLYSIRFKNTKQWVRIDSIQHVICFWLRLYFIENNIEA